jgi:PKD repeat protein
MKPIYQYLLICIAFSALITGCRRVPLAKFEVSASTITPGETVTFDNKTFNGKSYLWDFGDGTTSTDKETTHTYNDEGSFTVTLTAYSKKGNNSSSKSQVITVAKSQAQVDAENSSTMIIDTWSLDSLNLDEINGTTHYNFTLDQLWGGTTQYLWTFNSPNTLDMYRDGNYENSDTWNFSSGVDLLVPSMGDLVLDTLSAQKFAFTMVSPSDTTYTETWFFTVL